MSTPFIYVFILQIANMFLIDSFLGGSFMTYGTDVLRFSSLNQEQRTDPMVNINHVLSLCQLLNSYPEKVTGNCQHALFT